MKQELLTEVLLEMREYVDNGQLKQLEKGRNEYPIYFPGSCESK